MASPKILVVEDDTVILELIFRFFKQKNYQLKTANDGRSALEIFTYFNPDLVILDINLPDIIGYDLCERMQKSTDVYVMMLTSRINPEDKIQGFRRGADDYVTKPFDLQELEWRVKALLKRQARREVISSQTPLNVLVWKDLTIDPNRREVTVLGQGIELTALEFDLLFFLASHPGKVWSRAELIEKVWKVSCSISSDLRVVDVHIGQIRRKIQAVSSRSYLIKTVRGVGYKFEVLTEKNIK
ncbi:two component transcriptional regulator, winged helix family [Gloeothece citriformis PCC 7424]|uniref:Two component transcriptional regulator, winged helix family n=1 Tax=Gloeothece citriformis (strain PCC 7424) TaxID=65393 RepID=B7K6Q7_GLOC7|nr:response regulator transcription factor [Gloeothece citriformis]ACK72606.1 two component transcriptional regulator, winged helix family [Gloeothece citriformis PCC 7424]